MATSKKNKSETPEDETPESSAEEFLNKLQELLDTYEMQLSLSIKTVPVSSSPGEIAYAQQPVLQFLPRGEQTT